MSPEENKAIVRRYLKQVWNHQNLAVIDEAIAPDLVQHIRNVPPGRDGIKKFFGMIHTAFPDARITIEDMVAEGDKVAWRFTIRGTHRGTFRNLPPTGRSIAQTGIAITRMRDGQMAENWNETDDLGLMQQLGVIPPSGQQPYKG